MIIDSHQHFWRLETGFYDWIPPADAVLKRNFEPAELTPQLRDLGIDGTILVQAANTEAELAELCAYAAAARYVRGIVGSLEVYRTGVETRIAQMATLPLLVGFRPPFTALFGTSGTLSDPAQAALGAMQSHGLAFDCLASGAALGLVPALAQSYAEMNLVIDHGGNPDLDTGSVSVAWRESMRQIARNSNAFCKLSGLLTRLPAGVDTAVLAEHVAILFDLFGPGRLLWGSDWPVLTKAADYASWLELSQELTAGLSPEECEAVFGGNAVRVYKLGSSDAFTA